MKSIINFEPCIQKILKARLNLYKEASWLGTLTTAFDYFLVGESSPVKTAAVINQKAIYFNQEFVEGLRDDEVVFLLAHELLHCILNHFDRSISLENYNQHLWNIACDYTVNRLLVKHKIGYKIQGALYDSKYDEMTSEQIYADLLKQSAEETQTQTLETLDEHSLGEETSQLKDSKIVLEGEGDFTEKFKRAVALDNHPLLQEVSTILLTAESAQGEVCWQQELSRIIRQKIHVDFTYSVPSRKLQSLGIITPGILKKDKVLLAIGIDTSTSVSPKWVKKFLKEVGSLLNEETQLEVHIWNFGETVNNAQVLRNGEGVLLQDYEINRERYTGFELNWEHLKNNDINPDLLIIFSDGEPSKGWGEEGYCDTLFVIVQDLYDVSIIPPFGDHIRISSQGLEQEI
jgi:predicted metal-dependent peptidase